MQITCIMIIIATTLYFLFAQRQFDFFSVAIFSGLFYFSPVFLGYAYNPYLAALDKLDPKVYIIAASYFTLFSIGGIIRDILYPANKSISEKRQTATTDIYASAALAVIFILTFVHLLYTLGSQAFTVSKSELMSHLGIGFSIFCSCCLIGILYWYKRSWILFALVILGLIYLLIIGYRFLAILSLFSIMTLYLSKKGTQSLFLKNWIAILVIAIAGVFFFSNGLIGSSLKYATFSEINKKNLEHSIITIEPMMTQENLNLIVRNDFHVSGKYLLDNIATTLIPFSSKLGLKVQGFNEIIQPAFYKNYPYGVAANIWGEMYAIGGFTLLYGFMVLLSGICFFLSIYLARISVNVSALVIPVGVILFFYIHRNDFTYTLDLLRNLALIWLFINIFSLCRDKFCSKANGHTKPQKMVSE